MGSFSDSIKRKFLLSQADTSKKILQTRNYIFGLFMISPRFFFNGVFFFSFFSVYIMRVEEKERKKNQWNTFFFSLAVCYVREISLPKERKTRETCMSYQFKKSFFSPTFCYPHFASCIHTKPFHHLYMNDRHKTIALLSFFCHSKAYICMRHTHLWTSLGLLNSLLTNYIYMKHGLKAFH